ncbi:hypothetical protein BA93_02980 [Finegoldia magna ALB8]|nr:hypothetical protein BA93_02980 [Finegoldia magna ALB8]
MHSETFKTFKQTIELNIIIENLMFLVSDASNKKIFTSFSYTEDFRSEAERMRSLNFPQDIHTRYLLSMLFANKKSPHTKMTYKVTDGLRGRKIHNFVLL